MSGGRRGGQRLRRRDRRPGRGACGLPPRPLDERGVRRWASTVGFAEAGPAPAVLILNPDVRMDPGSIPPLLDCPGRRAPASPRRASARTRATSTSRCAANPPCCGRWGSAGSALPALSEYVQDRRPTTAGPVDWALGAMLAICSRRLRRSRRAGTIPTSSTPRRPTTACGRATSAGRRGSCRTRPRCTWGAVGPERLHAHAADREPGAAVLPPVMPDLPPGPTTF